MLLGGCSDSLKTWSKPDTLLNASNTRNLIHVAERLQVTVDQLFEVHSTAELEDGDHPQRLSKHNDPNNCLCNYRTRKGLSYCQLADRMGGISNQRVQHMCKTSRASKAGIERICRYEKMTPEEFVALYGGERLAD